MAALPRARLEASDEATLRHLGLTDRDITFIEHISTVRVQRAVKVGGARQSYKIPHDVNRRIRRQSKLTDAKFEERFGLNKRAFKQFVRMMHKALVVHRRTLRLTKYRSRRLGLKVRSMRFLQLMRGASVDTMLELYGQSATTVHNDFHLFIFVARKYLVPLLVKMPLKTSPEYDGLVGQGVFVTCMPRIIYLGDLTFVEFGSPPPEEEAEFYCAHKKKHGAYFLTLDDGTGEGRAIAGPYPGSVKDGRAMAMSDLTARLKRYVFFSDTTFRHHFF